MAALQLISIIPAGATRFNSMFTGINKKSKSCATFRPAHLS